MSLVVRAEQERAPHHSYSAAQVEVVLLQNLFTRFAPPSFQVIIWLNYVSEINEYGSQVDLKTVCLGTRSIKILERYKSSFTLRALITQRLVRI